MKLKLLTLIIAWVAVDAYNIRGSEDEALVDQSARLLHHDSYRRYPRSRKSDPTLFLVEDDSSRSTKNCADDLEYEFEDCVYVEITDTDEDADTGDYVFYIDKDTDCGDLEDDIDEELGCTSGYRRYKYGGGFRRYRYFKNRWWNRYHDSHYGKNSRDDDDDDDDGDHTHTHKWWYRDHDYDGYHDRNRWGYHNRPDNDEDEDTKKKTDTKKTNTTKTDTKKTDTKKTDTKKTDSEETDTTNDGEPKDRPFRGDNSTRYRCAKGDKNCPGE